MQEVLVRLADVPFARMFVLAGIIFLLVAVLGKVEGKIDPGKMGRIGAAVLGVVLLMLGILLQYIEIRDVNQERMALKERIQQQNTLAKETLNAMAETVTGSKPASAPASTEKPLLKIISGTFGKGCNAKPGNATASLAKACDGKQACDYAVEQVDLGKTSESCIKDFAAEWKCGNGSGSYSATFPPAAAKDKIHLECSN